MKITVIDKRCGDRKSQGMVEYIKKRATNTAFGEKFLYITPYLEQCHSIAGTKPIEEGVDDSPKYDKNGVIYNESEYNLGCIRMKHPNQRNTEGTKQESLRLLMQNREHIISTHKLFLDMKLDTLENADKYTLVIDESLEVFDRCEILTPKQANKLLRLNILEKQSDGITLFFNRDNFGKHVNLLDGEDAIKDTHYEELAVLCDNKQLLLVNGNILVWEFSAEILKKFKKVFILTYLFEGREMSVYLKKHNIEYEVIKGNKGGKDIAHLVEVLDDVKLNSVGDGAFALSVSKTRRLVGKKGLENKPPSRCEYDTDEQYEKALKRHLRYESNKELKMLSAEETNDILRRNLHTVMNNRWKAKADDRFFTCLESNKSFIAGKNYRNNWLSFNIKATNLYRTKHHVAFLMNVFMQPSIKQVCDSANFEVDADLVALSHLIQFIFRSALRCNEPIKVYIPSERMRNLFLDYLDGKYD